MFVWLQDEASKVSKNSTKCWFAVNWSHKFVIVPAYFNVRKRYGVFIFNLRSESDKCYEIRDIIVQKVDRGNTVVVLNRKDYVCKMKNVLNDRSKFENVYLDHGKILNHTIHMENRVTDVLKNLRAKREIFIE